MSKTTVSKEERKRIWNRVRRAIKSGRIVKPAKCSECKRTLPVEQIQGHHFDYEQELEVVWVCQQCHSAIHNRSKPKKGRSKKTVIRKRSVDDLIKRWC